MGTKAYKGLMVREADENQFTMAIEELSTEGLPAGDVLVKVLFSSLNYKDMLSANGNRGVTKKYPHTPGIDAAGIVEESSIMTTKGTRPRATRSRELKFTIGQLVRHQQGAEHILSLIHI